MVKREREIQAFVPEPYWLVHAQFDPRYEGLWFEGEETRIMGAHGGKRADEIAAKVSGAEGVVETVERKEQSERAPLLYDLTSLQRDANRRFGFSARRTLQAAQSLYEDKKAITYPRTSSRWLSGDLVAQLKPTAATLAPIGEYAQAASYVLGLQQLPLGRVVNDSKVDDHHAIIPTDVEHDLERFSPDERRVFDLIARRFLAVFHPPARYARTTIVTLVEEERFRTRGKVTLEAGWRGVYGLEADADKQARQDEDAENESAELPQLEQGQKITCAAAEVEAKETRPPPRYTEATLLSAMETAGKFVDDEELREAMKERGLGTPATRAETIETLIRREYIERVAKDLQPTPKGLQVITMLEEHPLTSPGADRRLGEAPDGHRARRRRPRRLHQGHRDVHAVHGRADRGAGQGEAATRARRARPLPALRRRDRRDHQGELEGLRLHELEEPRGDRVRIRHLEARRGPHSHPRDRTAAPRGGEDQRGHLRLPLTCRQTFSRAARLE